MATIAAIGIEGVLAHPERDTKNFASQAPVQTGLRLLVALQTMYKTVLLCDEADAAPVDHFLAQNNLHDHAYLILREAWQVGYDHAELRMAQVEHLRGVLSMPVSLVVDPDPRVAAQVMHQGIVGVLFAHPQYQRPEFRPDDDRGVRAWDEIVNEITVQRELKGQDQRLTPGLGI